MPLYSTFLPVGSTLRPPRVIVPSWVPRAVHSWTTRSSRVYWVVVAFAALLAIRGAQQGFVAGALALVGLVAGAIVGGRLASALLESGNHSRYAPLIALGGGLLLVVLFQALGLRIGLELRSEVLRIPPLRSLDTAGGFLLGAATGLFLAWAVGVVALQLPGQTSLRREVQ